MKYIHLITAVGFVGRAVVLPDVGSQPAPGVVLLSAVPARMVPLAQVDLLVDQEVLLHRELLGARGALELLGLLVGHQVALQLGPGGECGLAMRAGVTLACRLGC